MGFRVELVKINGKTKISTGKVNYINRKDSCPKKLSKINIYLDEYVF